MAYYKKFIILFLILFILFFNFSSVFASESEVVNGTRIGGINCNTTSNYFFADNNGAVTTYEVELGYVYYITIDPSNFERPSVYTSSYPAVNVVFDRIYTFTGSGGAETFSYIPSENGYISLSGTTTNIGTVTREKVASQETAISDLVSNVGPNAFWGVFGSGVDFIFIIVIVAFGLFIIYKLIKGFSKGKSKI